MIKGFAAVALVSVLVVGTGWWCYGYGKSVAFQSMPANALEEIAALQETVTDLRAIVNDHSETLRQFMQTKADSKADSGLQQLDTPSSVHHRIFSQEDARRTTNRGDQKLGFMAAHSQQAKLGATPQGVEVQGYSNDASEQTNSSNPPYVPLGGIIDWWMPEWAAENPIPDGYEACDGSKVFTVGPLFGAVKPDLRERFTKGINSSKELGKLGGSNNHTHSLQTGLDKAGHISQMYYVEQTDGGHHVSTCANGKQLTSLRPEGDWRDVGDDHGVPPTASECGVEIFDPPASTEVGIVDPPHMGVFKLLRVLP